VRGVRVIAGLTCREAVRRKVLLAALVLGAAFLVLFAFGLHLTLNEPILRQPLLRRQATIFMVLTGMYAINWLAVVMTILTSVDTVAGEIASGVIQAVATKPIRRWEVMAGKWVGFAALLGGFLLLIAGGLLVEVRLLAGFTPTHLFGALGLMWLECLLLLALNLRVGASLSTLATGITVFGLHILAFLGGWIEEFGSLAHSQTAANIGVIASVIMPSEALWRRAASDLQGTVVGSVGALPFSSGSAPSTAMVVYAGLYLVAALALAMRRFTKRDL
jgi:Cu-processing system permease protein